ADHELRVELALAEQRRDPQQRPAVGLPQPAEPDHPDAEAPARRRGAPRRARRLRSRAHPSDEGSSMPSRLSSCSSASSSAPPDISLTSSSREIPFLGQSPVSRPRLRIPKRSPTGKA